MKITIQISTDTETALRDSLTAYICGNKLSEDNIASAMQIIAIILEKLPPAKSKPRK